MEKPTRINSYLTKHGTRILCVLEATPWAIPGSATSTKALAIRMAKLCVSAKLLLCDECGALHGAVMSRADRPNIAVLSARCCWCGTGEMKPITQAQLAALIKAELVLARREGNGTGA